MKNINDITFDNNLEQYQSEIENINRKFERLNHDKSVQKLYKRYLKAKDNIEVRFNKVTDNINKYKIIDTENYTSILRKNNSKNNKYQFDVGLC